jgi:hypothetical protein
MVPESRSKEREDESKVMARTAGVERQPMKKDSKKPKKQKVSRAKFPRGWDEKRVRKVARALREPD